MEKPKEYRIFRLQDGDIRDNGTRIDTLEALKECLQGDDIAIMPVGDAPENWQDMTIAGGKLVPASDEEMAERNKQRERAALVAEESELLEQLAATDFKAIKYAEGAYDDNPEEYEPVREQRAEWRRRINEIREMLNTN